MKTYKILIEIRAECDADKDEILEVYDLQHPLEEEWSCCLEDNYEE